MTFSINLLKYFLYIQVIEWISEIKGTQSVTLIGLTDLDTEGKFVWESGRELSDDVAAFWKEGQPNNHYGLEHCTCIVNGLMMDRICEDPSPKDPEPHGFVCQKRMQTGIGRIIERKYCFIWDRFMQQS